MKNYLIDTSDETSEDEVTTSKKIFVLIIYDIVENKKRNKIAKLLKGYGFRIQKSAFEAIIVNRKYKELLEKLKPLISSEDSIRIYKIRGSAAVTVLGKDESVKDENIVII